MCTRRIESENARLRIKTTNPRKNLAGHERTKCAFERSPANRRARVPIVIARNHRHSFRVAQQRSECIECIVKFGSERRRRQIASNENVIGVETQNALDHVVQPFQPKPARTSCQQARDADRTLVQKPNRIEAIAPEMNVGEVDDSQRSQAPATAIAQPSRYRCQSSPPTSTS